LGIWEVLPETGVKKQGVPGVTEIIIITGVIVLIGAGVIEIKIRKEGLIYRLLFLLLLYNSSFISKLIIL
jgi:hypothetical protein